MLVINPVSLSGDQRLISPYNGTAWLNFYVRRIKEVIIKDEMPSVDF